jgi:PAS domain S-box-containing protein
VDVQALLEKLRDYETVIETMHCGLLAEDPEGIVVFANQRLLDWLSYPREEIVGHHVEKLVPPELRELLAEDVQAASEGDLRARLLAIRRKDSTTFPVVTIPQRFFGADGQFDGFFSVIVDLGTVLTAKQVGPSQTVDLRATLSRIAMELQSISLSAGLSTGTSLPLHHPELQGLSPRETEVLSLLVSGDRVPGIAEQLHISQHTVRNHLKSMYRKLGVGTQAALIEQIRKLASGPPAGAPDGA